MAFESNSPNMNLPVPGVGLTDGPQYATDVNNCLTLVDQHDHSPGKGVQITPAGLNITSDLPININNLTLARSVRFSPQVTPLAGPSDLGCLYESGVDLYYNDGSGNQVRITQSGGVAGSPGSIANLTSPASASYVALTKTFVWQSDALTPANLDAGSLILRNIVSGSDGLTLSPPTLVSDYTLTLPFIPGSTKLMTLDASGVMAATVGPDNSTIEISSSNLQVKNAGITQPKLYTRTTAVSATAGNVAINAETSDSTSSASATPMGTAITLVTTGRPVFIAMVAGNAGSGASIVSNSSAFGRVFLYRDGAQIAFSAASGGTGIAYIPILNWLDTPTAGSHSYQIWASVPNGNLGFTDFALVAFEIN